MSATADAPAPAAAGSGRLAADSATVGGWTLVSRVLGLVRIVVIGAVLGPTFFANTFQAGYTVPNLLFTVVAGPVLAMVAVPAVVRAVGDGGRARAREFLGRLSGLLLVVAAGLSVVLLLAAPAVAWTLTAGIPDPVVADRARALCTLLVALVAPQVVLYTAAGLAVAAQQARGRFGLAAAAPAMENVVVIVVIAVTAAVFGSGLEVDRIDTGMVVLLGVGSTGAVAAHLALQLVGVARAGLLVRPRGGGRRDPEVRAAAGRLLRAVPVAACPAVGLYVLLAVASTVAGGVFVVQVAVTVFYALSYLGPRAVAMAALPDLARTYVSDRAAFGAGWRRGLSFAVIAGLPPLVLLAALAPPTASLLALGSAGTDGVTAALAGCLVLVAVAQLVGGLHDIGRQALYACGDDRSPRSGAFLTLVGTGGAAATALLVAPGGARLFVLVGGLLLGECIAAAFVLARLRSAVRPGALADARGLLAATAGALGLVPVALLGRGVLELWRPDDVLRLGVLLATGLLGLTVYVLAVRRVGVRAP